MHTIDQAASADRNFILQQGYDSPAPASCMRLSSALRFQPRVVGLIAAAGTVSQSPSVYATLAALLGVSALWPRWNPFDFVYNHTLGRRAGAPALGPAPMPRRFAQGLAATFAIAIVACLASGHSMSAWVIQSVLLLAAAALIVGRFCFGSFVYHLVRGRLTFAIRTLPWRAGA
jgi:hypothetical protein